MMPSVMTSHPTVGCERRADSFWAVTREEMHSSDIRSKIIQSDDDDEDDVDDGWVERRWNVWMEGVRARKEVLRRLRY